MLLIVQLHFHVLQETG